MSLQQDAKVMALDIGLERTGVALAHVSVPIPRPFKTLLGTEDLAGQVAELVKTEQVEKLVIGLPRNLSGEHTDQTRYVEVLAAKIKRAVAIPVYFVDEALTSIKAEENLRGQGREYTKADIDMLAAAYILDDFLKEHPEFVRV